MAMLFEKQIEKIYRSNLFVRNDNADGIFYFTPEDFPGLRAHAYGFQSRKGHDLRGFFYRYDKAVHFDELQQALGHKDNIRFHLEQGKGHNPNYTADAVAYKDAFFGALTRAKKKKQLVTPRQQEAFMERYDWHRMTAQDEQVWELILRHLKEA